jgi:ribosomal protein S27E
MMYAYIDIRCPQCNNSLGELVIYSGHPFSISGKFKYCPYCGVDIDSTLSHTPHRI